MVSRAGTRLLVDVADATGLSREYSKALLAIRQRDRGHDPGRVALDLAVMLADGGEAISDLAVLRAQPDLFGVVASGSTAWRLLNALDAAALDRLRQARASARRAAWAVAGGQPPRSTVAGRNVAGLVLDLDATIVVCHSPKEQAGKTFKRTFGYHPLLCFLDATGEALAGVLRPGGAGSNTIADHIEVLDRALAQIPAEHRFDEPVLVRADAAGSARAFLAHVRGLRQDGIATSFSIGVHITQAVREAISQCVDWVPALDTDGSLRDGAEVAEITHLIDLSTFPDGTRLIVRRERPHPGAPLTLFDDLEGKRHQVFATDTPRTHGWSIQLLELRHRGHARVEDRIRTGKDTGFGRFPSRQFAINQAWLELALTGIDLLAWTQLLLLDGQHARAEPKRLRYRLLHAPARIIRTARQTKLRISQTWPWARDLAAAYTRLAALPRPAA